VVGFDPIVRVLVGVVERRRDELIDHRPERPGPVRHDFGRIAMRAKRRRKEPSCRVGVVGLRVVVLIGVVELVLALSLPS
jgi:hypothetical protein